MRKPTKAAEIVLEALENCDNKLPSRQLARIIYEKNKTIFKDQESVRALIRYYRGKTGGFNRKELATNKFVIKKQMPYNPYKLPESYNNKREPIILPKQCTNILVMSDLHIPFHSNDAITAALDYGVKNKIDTVILNGDIMDMFKYSRFIDYKKMKSDIPSGFEQARQFLEVLRNTFPNILIYFIKGNHEMWWEQYMFAKAPEIFNDSFWQLEDRLRTYELKITMLGDKEIIKAGKLSILHGHTVFRGAMSPVSPARTIFMKIKGSAICGHTHKISEYSWTDVAGEIHSCWSSGCMCELTPDYNPLPSNDNSHGFAHVILKPSGDFNVRNYRIYKGKIL